MKRKLVIATLLVGTVGGFAWGVHSRRGSDDQMKERLAEVCVDAALGETTAVAEGEEGWGRRARLEAEVRQLCEDAAARRRG